MMKFFNCVNGTPLKAALVWIWRSMLSAFLLVAVHIEEGEAENVDVPHSLDRKTKKANKDKDWNRVYFNKRAKDKRTLP